MGVQVESFLGPNAGTVYMRPIVGSFYMFLAGVCIVMMEFKYKIPFIKVALRFVRVLCNEPVAVSMRLLACSRFTVSCVDVSQRACVRCAVVSVHLGVCL